MKAVGAALLLFALGLSACGSTRGDETELVLRGDAIARQIQSSLGDAKGELHCDRVGPDGKRSPGCFVQLGPSLGDRRFEFSLPDRVVDLGYAGEIVYKVYDVRLKKVEVSSAAGEFVVRAAFASKDVALKGSHSALGDAVVPDIKLANMLLTVHLKPVARDDGRITYDQPKVEFTASVDNTFIPRFEILGQTIDVLDTLTNYRRDLCRSIQMQIQRALDEPARKEALARKIQEGITGQMTGSMGSLVGLRFQGTDLVVKLRR